MNTDLTTQFLDADTVQALTALAAPVDRPAHVKLAKYKTSEYNAVFDSIPAYGALAETAPGLARIYLERLSGKSQSMSHPGQIVKKLRVKWNITPAQWRILHRLANHPARRVSCLSELLTTARAAASANHPEATDDMLLLLHNCQHTLHHHKHARKGAGREAHRAAWRRVMQAFLAPDADRPTAPQLRQVSDALSDRLARKLTWGPGSWEQMLARAARWQMECLRDAEDDRYTPDPLPPPLSTHSRGGYQLTPLRTNPARRAAEKLLGRWLPGRYVPTNRLEPLFYLATAPGKDPAVLELSIETGAWQHRGVTRPPHLPRESQELTQLAKELAAECREADPKPNRRLGLRLDNSALQDYLGTALLAPRNYGRPEWPDNGIQAEPPNFHGEIIPVNLFGDHTNLSQLPEDED